MSSSGKVAGLAALITLAGCGGSPTAPSNVLGSASGWPAGTVLQVVGGDTGAPVAAQVLVGGAPYAGSAAAQRDPVDISASGYLPRQTAVRAGETTFVLWPDSSRLPGDYTRAIVYTASQGLGPMARVTAQTVSVIPSDQIRADSEAIATHRGAITEINAALAGRVVYDLDGAGSVRVSTKIDHADPNCTTYVLGVTYLTLASDRSVTRAEVVFCTAQAASSWAVVHELGHTFGLQHSPNPNDVMVAVRRSGDLHATFSAKERLIMALMCQRRPGNAWPDNDRGAPASQASSERVVVLVD